MLLTKYTPLHADPSDAGQLPLREVYDQLSEQGVSATLVGGAFEAAELDAKKAIDQASRLAAVA